jgi:hypothetical protein
MAKQTIISLNVPAASTTNGTAVNVEKLYYKTIIFSGITGTTLQIELSNDGTTYVKAGSDVTANSVVKVDEQAKFLRIRTQTFGSGTPAASLAALNHRTD